MTYAERMSLREALYELRQENQVFVRMRRTAEARVWVMLGTPTVEQYDVTFDRHKAWETGELR